MPLTAIRYTRENLPEIRNQGVGDWIEFEFEDETSYFVLEVDDVCTSCFVTPREFFNEYFKFVEQEKDNQFAEVVRINR